MSGGVLLFEGRVIRAAEMNLDDGYLDLRPLTEREEFALVRFMRKHAPRWPHRSRWWKHWSREMYALPLGNP